LSFPEEFTAETVKTSKLRRSIVPELIRGRTGRIFGVLLSALIAIKGLPSHYTRDYQEDKEASLEASESIKTCINVLSQLFETISFNTAEMHRAVIENHFETLVLVEYLFKNGKSHKKAIGLVRDLINYCSGKSIRLDQISLEELQSVSKDLDKGILQLLTPKGAVQNYASLGSSNPVRIQHEIEEWNSKLGSLR